MSYLFVFALGAAACYAVVYFGTHPTERDALFSRIRGLFHRD